ncbi:MAG: hypothetical protein OEZ01_12965, partial [Candidatus Heimdallarchaeota archaeon]|nr:hypothetical protein [Candidatus Heimdallarchaeota archaeon]
EKLAVRNSLYVYHYIGAFSFNFNILEYDADGFLVHFLVAILLLILGNAAKIELAIYIWIQLNSLLLTYSTYQFLKSIQIESQHIPYYLSFFLFFDWVIFPTVDFRPEGFGISLFYLILSKLIERNSKAKTFKLEVQIVVLMFILSVTHFLSFLFFSIFIYGFCLIYYFDKELEKIIDYKIIFLSIFSIHYLILFIYDKLFLTQGYMLSLYLGTMYKFSLNLVLLLKLTYITFWFFVFVLPSHVMIFKIFDISTKLINKYKHLLTSKKLTLIIQITMYFSLVYILSYISTLYIPDITKKGLWVLIFNSWKLLIILIVIYNIDIFSYNFSQLNCSDKNNKIIAGFIFSTFILIVFGIVYLPIIHNTHMRMFPLLALPLIIFMKELSFKHDFPQNKSKLIIFSLFWFLLNISNGTGLNQFL